MGEDLAYTAKRYINSKESKAPEAYRDMIIDAGASDIVYTAAVSEVPANFLGPNIKAMNFTEEMLSRKVKVNFGEELTAQEDDANAWATIWYEGQGVSTIEDSPSIRDLISNLKNEFKAAIEEQYRLLERYK